MKNIKQHDQFPVALWEHKEWGRDVLNPVLKQAGETRDILIPLNFFLPDSLGMVFNLQSSFHFFTSEGEVEGRVCTAL